MDAVFQLEDTFTLTRRGLVLAGQIVEGVVRVGDRVRVPIDGSERLIRVTAVEAGHRRTMDGSPGGFVGLVLGDLPGDGIAGVRAVLMAGQRLSIERAT